jgi:cobalamin-dependent methionine synthase I
MTRFLNWHASEPEICRVPIMTDSSAVGDRGGLKRIPQRHRQFDSPKEGEAKFLEQARLAGVRRRRCGDGL